MKKILISVTLIVLSVMPPAGAESLFNEATYKPIMSDHKSFDAGQILTVLIFEQASAATSADTDTDRSMNIAGEARGNDNRNTGSLSFQNDFEGGGTITRAGKLVASVTVTITERLANGELLISGEQVIEFNDEDQHIRLTGRVRPEDISTDNTILSTRVADARITYVGDGLLGKRQKPGFLTRFFGWLF